MAEDKDIDVSIDGLGLKFTGKVTLQQAIEMLRVASLDPDAVPRVAESQESGGAGGGVFDLALSELINEIDPKTSAETIALIALWVMETEGKESISRQDVRDRYQEARLPPPANFPRDFSTAISKGYLAPIKGDRNSFYVTRTGRKLAELEE
ncbi:hypothetical protein [Parasphingopyxis sp.]|uniref:hypothetical protein n=1 Tax=Parasphingopyxis sp. TaxID=1920299 RepID=UPI00262369FC|nr:hypothetical protein [Parasphingopyxis sp.]